MASKTMGITPLTRAIMKKFFGKKRLFSFSKSSSSKSSSNVTAAIAPPPPSTPVIASPQETFPPSVHGHCSGRGAPPQHAPPNACGYVSSYTIHGGGGGINYVTPAKANVYDGSALHGTEYGVHPQPSPRVEYPPAHGAYGVPESTPEDTYDPVHQLIAEEAIKSQVRSTKHQSTETDPHPAVQAGEIGHNTLARLRTQGDSLQNTRENPVFASIRNRVTEEKISELKTLNGSSLAIHTKNPLRSTVRVEAENAKVLALHQADLGTESNENHSKIDKVLNDTSGKVEPRAEQSTEERTRYKLEADESNSGTERQIEMNPEEVVAASTRLKKLALATEGEQNRHIRLISVFQMENDQL